MKKYICFYLFFILFGISVFCTHAAEAKTEAETKLEEKYFPKFQAIEQEAVTRLHNLIDEAYMEYEKKKGSNQHTLPVLFSYIEKGKKLEDEIELKFLTLLHEMQLEIDQLGLPDELSASFESQYIKSKRKSKLQILKNITIEGQKVNFQRDM